MFTMLSGQQLFEHAQSLGQIFWQVSCILRHMQMCFPSQTMHKTMMVGVWVGLKHNLSCTSLGFEEAA